MAEVKTVSPQEMEQYTGLPDALGYTLPQNNLILLSDRLEGENRKAVLKHEWEHLKAGEEGPFWGAVIGGALSLLGSKKASDAAGSAAGDSAELQKYIYDTNREDYAPYREIGTNALYQLASLYGLGGAPAQLTPQYDESQFDKLANSLLGSRSDWTGYSAQKVWDDENDFHVDMVRDPSRSPEAYDQALEDLKQSMGLYNQIAQLPEGQTTGMDAFFTSPGYQFRMDQGINALDRSAAARGRLNSGAQTKAITDYAQGVASNEFGNYVNQLNNLAGIGQAAQNSTAALGQNYANQAGAAMQNAGNARASGYLGMTNAIGQAVGNYNLYNALNQPTYASGYTDLMGQSGYGNMF